MIQQFGSSVTNQYLVSVLSVFICSLIFLIKKSLFKKSFSSLCNELGMIDIYTPASRGVLEYVVSNEILVIVIILDLYKEKATQI